MLRWLRISKAIVENSVITKIIGRIEQVERVAVHSGDATSAKLNLEEGGRRSWSGDLEYCQPAGQSIRSEDISPFAPPCTAQTGLGAVFSGLDGSVCELGTLLAVDTDTLWRWMCYDASALGS